MKSLILSGLIFITYGATALPSEEVKNKIACVVALMPADANLLWKNVKIEVNYEIPMPARSRKTDDGLEQIQVNPHIMQMFPESAQKFIMLHELGHLRLDHTVQIKTKSIDLDEVEYEADFFAAHMAKRMGLVDRNLITFVNTIIRESSGRNGFFGDFRANLILSILK